MVISALVLVSPPPPLAGSCPGAPAPNSWDCGRVQGRVLCSCLLPPPPLPSHSAQASPRVARSLLGTGVALYHLCQLHLVVKAQQPDPVLGSVLDLCNLLTGVGADDLTGRDANTLDQLHLCLWVPKVTVRRLRAYGAHRSQRSTNEMQSRRYARGGP